MHLSSNTKNHNQATLTKMLHKIFPKLRYAFKYHKFTKVFKTGKKLGGKTRKNLLHD